MDTAYWNLFWTTGLPEAWLMSREPDAPAGRVGSEELFGPLTPARISLSSNVPGGPERLY